MSGICRPSAGCDGKFFCGNNGLGAHSRDGHNREFAPAKRELMPRSRELTAAPDTPARGSTYSTVCDAGMQICSHFLGPNPTGPSCHAIVAIVSALFQVKRHRRSGGTTTSGKGGFDALDCYESGKL
jgi:hypothetical protein